MAINFSVGEFVVINRAYVEEILPTLNNACSKQTLTSLGYIGLNPSEVLATGSVGVSTLKSFIHVRPSDTTNPAYRNNQGVVIYFSSDDILNNSFELSTAYRDDKCFVKALNSSGSTITKGSLVYQTGFNGTEQLPTIAAASAAASSTCAVLGICVSEVDASGIASILIDGSFNGIDTSAFSVNDLVFLSDTPGEISTVAGTEEKIVGRVIVASTEGSITLVESLGGSGGGGGGGGFFTDGTGTNAAIGQGATPPTATMANALAQGDSSNATGINSVAIGTSNTASGANSTAVGNSNSATTESAVAFGSGNSVTGGEGFASGQNNMATGGESFAQGYNNDATADQTFAQGRDNTVSAAYSFAQGYNNTVTGTYSMTQGFYNSVDGNYSFSQGRDNDTQGNYSFAQGYSNNANSYYSFAQGYNVTIEDSATFSQGYDNYIGSGNGYNFAQGANHYIGSSQRTMAQGYNCDITDGYNVFMQGSYIDGDNSGDKRQVFAQGYQLTLDTTTSNSFVQGYNMAIDGSQVMLQGYSNSGWDGSALENAFIQGYNNNFDGNVEVNQVMVQGRDNSVGGEAGNLFVQGYSIDARGSYDTLLQGRTHDLDGSSRNRVFAQGVACQIQQDDQKAWGSNRTTPVGGAQSNKVVKFFTTVNSTTFGYNIPISTDRTYCITAKIVARNTTTAAESACFVLSQALAYNDAGAAVLVGTPAFTQVDSGGGAAAWSAGIGTSGTNIQINYTGDATDTVQWCLDIEYVQVQG